LGAREHGDHLGQLGIRWQGAVGGPVGAQDVGQYQRVAGIGFLPRDRVAIAVAVHGLGVDRVHLAAGGAQAGHQQASVGLDRHGNGVLGAVAGLGQQRQQQPEPGRVVADAPLAGDVSFGIDQRHVVVVFGPVDAA
jgi:hypothetical protein